MDNFIDTCIILAKLNKLDDYNVVCETFLDCNSHLIISEYQAKEEIPRLFRRKEKILSESIKSITLQDYNIDYSDFSESNILELKKIIAKIHLKQINENNLREMMEILFLWKRETLRFIATKIERKVIPIGEINEELVKTIIKGNQNKADAKIITSAIQEHQVKPLIAFTLDKKDWKINSLKGKIQALNYKCPEVRFLR